MLPDCTLQQLDEAWLEWCRGAPFPATRNWQDLRFGQFFLSKYYMFWPELFYQESPDTAYSMIYEKIRSE